MGKQTYSPMYARNHTLTHTHRPKIQTKVSKSVVLVTFCFKYMFANNSLCGHVCTLCPASSHTHTHTLDIIFRPFLSFYFRCVSVRGKERGGESQRAGGICKINTNITHRYVLQPDIIPTHACGFCICFYRFCLILFFCGFRIL